MKWIIARAAQRDIDNIRRDSVDVWGAARTRSYLAGIYQIIKRAAAQPNRYPLLEGSTVYRRVRAGSHIVLYRLPETENIIVVVRVLHERMDIGAAID